VVGDLQKRANSHIHWLREAKEKKTIDESLSTTKTSYRYFVLQRRRGEPQGKIRRKEA